MLCDYAFPLLTLYVYVPALLSVAAGDRAVNYNHWGAPKRWYGVPSAAAPAFEDAFKSALPDKFEQHPDLLFHLTAMLSPRTLLDHNVPVFAVLQAWPPVLQTECPFVSM